MHLQEKKKKKGTCVSFAFFLDLFFLEENFVIDKKQRAYFMCSLRLRFGSLKRLKVSDSGTLYKTARPHSEKLEKKTKENQSSSTNS